MSRRAVRGLLLSVLLLLLIMGGSLIVQLILVCWGIAELGLIAHRRGRPLMIAYYALVAVGAVFLGFTAIAYRSNLQLISSLKETGGSYASVSGHILPGPIDYISLGSDVGDQELKRIVSLEGLENVESVVAKNCKITDRGLLYLGVFKKLGHVYVAQTRVTPEGIEKLQELLPDCLIVYDID